MRCSLALEARFDRTPDGAVWSDGSFDAGAWRRYLEVFDQLNVIGRVRDVQEPPSNAQRVDGERVCFAALPYFVGPWQFAARYIAVRRAVRGLPPAEDAVVLRLPGTIGSLLYQRLIARGQPYAVEVVGDPHDVFAPGGVRSLLSPLMRWWYPRNLRRQVAGAAAVRYVTSQVLQRRYPAGAGAYVTACSDVELPDEAFVSLAPKPRPASSLRLVLIGSLDQLYKGPDVLIGAVARCQAAGVDVTARIVGDGRHRGELEQLAREAGVGARIVFVGRLPAGAAVRAEIDASDVFVMPSRTEGLPRAMVEAMARGVPCLGSAVGGIPELLSAEALVPPGDVEALADKIHWLAGDVSQRSELGARNLEQARSFHRDTLRARERAFYDEVRRRAAQACKGA